MRAFLCISLSICLTVGISAEPVVGSVVNGASFAAPGLPNSNIAQGSIFTVFGEGLGPSTLWQADTLPLPLTLGGTSIKINGTIDAIVLYTSANQVAAVLPSKTPVGTATLTVSFFGKPSAPLTFTVVPSSFGAFAQNQAGAGAGIAFNYLGAGSEPLNTPLTPAVPNQVVTIWGTGLGAVSGDEALPGAKPVSTPTEIYVGGQLAHIEYSGRSSCCVGVDQVNFRVPSGVTGCRVPVTVKAGDVVGNYTTIAVVNAPGEVCADPLNLTPSDLTLPWSPGKVRSGRVLLQRSLTGAAISDVAQASFEEVPVGTAGPARPEDVAVGSCQVTSFQTSSAADPAARSKVTYLDAGLLTVSNAAKSARPLSRFGGVYGAALNDTRSNYLEPGTFTVTGQGGHDVGKFSQTVTIGSPVTWLNAAAVTTVSRGSGLEITWSGGDASTYAVVQGSAVTAGGVGAAFFCVEASAKKRFVVPPQVLLALPAVDEGSGTGSLLVGSSSAPSRATPLPDGLDSLLVWWSAGAPKSVVYR